MFVAASVTESAIFPRATSSKPRRAARSIAARRASPIWLRSSIAWSLEIMLVPARDLDASALAGLGLDRELARETARASEPQAEPAARREAILEGQLEVGNTRAGIAEDQSEPPVRSVAEQNDLRVTSPAVLERVARELARRRHDLGLVDEREALRDRGLARRLAHAHHVL